MSALAMSHAPPRPLGTALVQRPGMPEPAGPARMRGIAAEPSTRLLLSTGATLEVAGTLEDVEKLLQNAVRSSQGTLARLQAVDSGEVVGVNPAQVVTVTRGR